MKTLLRSLAVGQSLLFLFCLVSQAQTYSATQSPGRSNTSQQPSLQQSLLLSKSGPSKARATSKNPVAQVRYSVPQDVFVGEDATSDAALNLVGGDIGDETAWELTGNATSYRSSRIGSRPIDQYPSPEPFPGANQIDTSPNTDYYCGSGLHGGSMHGNVSSGGYYPARGTKTTVWAGNGSSFSQCGCSGSAVGNSPIDQYPSPEPFLGANRINTAHNTDNFCGSGLHGGFSYGLSVSSGGYDPAQGGGEITWESGASGTSFAQCGGGSGCVGNAPIDQYPSPEPFPGANHINTAHNTDRYCSGGSLLGAFGCGGYNPRYGVIGNCGYDPCGNGGMCSPGNLFDCGQGFLIGWVEAGATFSPSDNNFPIRYNDQGNEFLMNQLYLSFGRAVNKNRNRFDMGARVDLLYGSDYFYTSALGLETFTYREGPGGVQYPVADPQNAQLRWNSNDGDRRDGTASVYGLAMPQLYAEFFLPIHRGFTFKAGHFYSIMGYESVMSPQNFFYSRSYTTMYGEPTTHTGMLFSQEITSGLAVHGGITRGWDTWESIEGNDKLSGLVGVQWDTCLGSSFAFTLHTGNTSVREGDNRTNYSLVYCQQLNPSWKYVIQHDLGTEDNGAYSISNYVETRSRATWASLVQYLECQWTPSCAFGLRFEWFQDNGHSRILQSPTSMSFAGGDVNIEGMNYYNITLGMKWKPLEYLTIRPEVRWDWSDVDIKSSLADVSSISGVYDDFTSKNQCTAAIDLILMF